MFGRDTKVLKSQVHTVGAGLSQVILLRPKERFINIIVLFFFFFDTDHNPSSLYHAYKEDKNCPFGAERACNHNFNWKGKWIIWDLLLF